MLRVLFDDHGSSTQNLFVKIDGQPSRVYVVDTSWLGDFLDSDETPIHTEDELILAKRAGVASLIRLWETILLSDQPICYLPYDLSDQYVGVLQVIKRKKLYRISRLWSPDLYGGLTSTYFFQVQATIAWQKEIDQDLEWELAPASILTGLRWSLANLEQPIVPLRYD